ncbi:MAG: hypothetical protein KBS94_04885 [Prevotella sp.]|nr:hypothetical protein [Candidatus Equicola faecalis]
MKLRQKIKGCYPQTKIILESADKFWIADLSRYSDNKKKVTVLLTENEVVSDTRGRTFNVNFLCVENPNILPVSIAIFDDHQFKKADNTDDVHCEGCFFPYFTCGNRWIAFLEIKDRKNVTEFRKDAKEQLINTIIHFKKNKILFNEQLFAIISWPKKKMSFNDLIFTDPIEQKQLKKQYGAIFVATNRIQIDDDENLIIL